MKNIAAHRIISPTGEVFHQHYVALDDAHRLIGIFPLEKEIAGTEFHNGTIRVISQGDRCEIITVKGCPNRLGQPFQ